MNDENRNILTLSFIDREPRSAARVLENIAPSDAAAFLNRAPARIVEKAVSSMIPWSAARCVERMKAEQASGLLRAMDYSDAVSILRLVGEEERTKLLALSTKRFARSFRNSLIYPKDTVGAWMDVGTPSFQDSLTVRDSVRAIRRMTRPSAHIFLTNADKQYAGVVAVSELLRRDETAIIGELADDSVRPLSNRDTLHACGSKAEWDRLTMLPVVGRKHNLLGGLSRSTLRKALADQDVYAQVVTPGSVLMQILSAYLTVGAAFANMTLLNNEAPVRQKKETARGRKRTRSH